MSNKSTSINQFPCSSQAWYSGSARPIAGVSGVHLVGCRGVPTRCCQSVFGPYGIIECHEPCLFVVARSPSSTPARASRLALAQTPTRRRVDRGLEAARADHAGDEKDAEPGGRGDEGVGGYDVESSMFFSAGGAVETGASVASEGVRDEGERDVDVPRRELGRPRWGRRRRGGRTVLSDRMMANRMDSSAAQTAATQRGGEANIAALVNAYDDVQTLPRLWQPGLGDPSSLILSENLTYAPSHGVHATQSASLHFVRVVLALVCVSFTLVYSGLGLTPGGYERSL
ncbi:uncharacterized protein BXZ73DRAFT_78724 [Epithele typhae]|uniref:uncharacterized protein n=1 Tax=Epithele typhae TaxID=378194 RepID=UPI00200878E6|nr:uncharacterized protein BXZ73DRAFT_78724 [Epithele typhae]KAH9926635.1 hypothetical protein BXZ73DRAFT_78724 [Epithele typhae]